MSPSPRQLIELAVDRTAGTRFDRALARGRRDPRGGFLFFWNRGLGDVVLALEPLFAIVREKVPAARITVVTRPELEEAFRMTDADDVRVIPGLTRSAHASPADLLEPFKFEKNQFCAVFAKTDPTRWLRGRRHLYPVCLRWLPQWDARAANFVPADDAALFVGVHIQSETQAIYRYVKDWPLEAWHDLVDRFDESDRVRWLLFGQQPVPPFEHRAVVDLRGRTGFIDMMSIIRNRCRVLIGPDSGVLNTAYYLDAAFPIDVISLWSDPRHGILAQRRASPNPQLVHRPLLGRDEDVRNIGVDEVERELRAAIAAARQDHRRVSPFP
jgi:ADP-heptose:LPS heptosyltransferase